MSMLTIEKYWLIALIKPHAYIGMIGSERKVQLTKKMFIEGKYQVMKN